MTYYEVYYVDRNGNQSIYTINLPTEREVRSIHNEILGHLAKHALSVNNAHIYRVTRELVELRPVAPNIGSIEP
jgi:hypothetical protein